MKKVFALVTLAVGVLFGAGAGVAHAYPPTITVNAPSSIPAGGTATVSLSGLNPGETYSIAYTDADGNLVAGPFDAVAGADGTATITVTAPTAPGSYFMTVTDDGGIVLSTSNVTVIKVGGPGNTGNKGNGALPKTGSDITTSGMLVGLAAIVGGLSLLFVSKRRRVAVS